MVRALEPFRIDHLGGEANGVARSIWRAICQLEIVSTGGQTCPQQGSERHKDTPSTLPEIVFPIDREYTKTFFGWGNSEFQNHPEACFVFAFQRLADLAREVDPLKYVGAGWNSCRSKVLDNAIVGFCRIHGLVSENTKRRKEEKEFVAKLKEQGIWGKIKAEFESRPLAEISEELSGTDQT